MSTWFLLVALGHARAQPLREPPLSLSDPTLPAWFGGRIVTLPGLHVGLRPAFELNNADGAQEVGLGATLQVTVSSLL